MAKPYLSFELLDDQSVVLNWHDGRGPQPFDLMSAPEWFQNWPPPRQVFSEPIYQLKLEMRKSPQVQFVDLSTPANVVLGEN